MVIGQQRVLDDMLNRALNFCFPRCANVSRRASLNDEDQKSVGHVMLTVSGLEFRLVMLLHINEGTTADDVYLWVRQLDRIGSQADERKAFYVETGNQMCGEIKRYLYKQFDCLGMSTPSFLSPSTDIADLKEPTLQTVAHQYCFDDDRFLLGGSLYLFAQTPLELSLDIRMIDEVFETGELEFF